MVLQCPVMKATQSGLGEEEILQAYADTVRSSTVVLRIHKIINFSQSTRFSV